MLGDFSKILIFYFLGITIINAQYLEGKVFSKNEKATKIPLVGATIRWENAKGGEITDPDGYFKIKKEPHPAGIESTTSQKRPI